MGLSILNNIPSLEAENQLGITNTNLQNTLFQLSSGSKINSGADDPAGLSIADGLQANISALTQSAQNVTDSTGMLQTADGALSQVTTLLNRAVTLATEAGTQGLTTGPNSQQAALQNEYSSITSEINQIGLNTTYNDSAVFTGASTSVFLSDGSTVDENSASGPTIAVSMPTLSASSLGLGTYATGTIDMTAVPTQGNTVNIGGQTYTFETTATAANQVAIGGSVNQTLLNLQAAVNGGAGAGTAYGTGTQPNASAQITTVTGGSATVQALNAGLNGNSTVLNSFLTNASGSSAANLSGGSVAVDATGTIQLGTTQPNILTSATGMLTMTGNASAGVSASGTMTLNANPSAGTHASGVLTLTGTPTTGDIVTVGSNAYTFVTSGDASTAGSVSLDANGNLTNDLTNLANAIQGTGSSGNGTYYASDPVTAGVTASVSGNQLTITNNTAGTAGNGAITFTASISNSNGAVTGTATNKLAGGTNPDTVTVGGTTYTFVAAGNATTGTEVALGTSTHATLLNLQGAVNTGGTGGGGTFYTNNGTAAANGAATIAVAGNIATVTAVASGTFGNAANIALNATFNTPANVTFAGLSGGATGNLSGGTAGDTVQVGSTTYTFVAAGQATQGTEVAVAGSGHLTLENLLGAVNSGGTGAGGSYYTNGGTASPNAALATNGMSVNNNVATFTAATAGTAGNSSVNLAATFANGTAAGVLSGLAGGQLSGGTNADTVTVGTTTYTFVAAGQATASNEVALGTGATAASAVHNTLVNLAGAITSGNQGAGNSWDMSSGANPEATMTVGASPSTTATVTAQGNTPAYAGANGNSVGLSSSISGAVVGGNGTLLTGANASGATGQLTFTTNPTVGDTVSVAGTTYTFVASGNATAADQVAINNNANPTTALNNTLTNLKNAVNTTGPGDANAGATSFGVGTGVNTAATITGVAAGVVSVQALLNPATPNNVGNGDTLSASLSGGAGGVVGTGFLAGGTAAASLGTYQQAQTALVSIEGAISTVASWRGDIGSGINQMNAALEVMNNTAQNLTSSMSSIQDANIGQVISAMSKYQVLEQTGIAALAQSNTSEQAILKLLP
jgi:flagellin